MKNLFGIILLIAMLTSIAICGFAEESIAIDSVNFPDEGLRRAVQESQDLNGDMMVSVDERDGMLDLVGFEVHSVRGLELLPHIVILDLSDNPLETLDLSTNPGLEYVSIDYCAGLKEINLSNSTELEYLSAETCGLEKLDLRGCKNLSYLNVVESSIASIDVSNNPLLQQLCVSDNGIVQDYLDLSNNPNLEELDTTGNQFGIIDISQCPKLVATVKTYTVSKDDDDVAWIYTGKDADGDLDTMLIIDRNTTLIAEGVPVYTPEMYSSLEEYADLIFPGF